MTVLICSYGVGFEVAPDGMLAAVKMAVVARTESHSRIFIVSSDGCRSHVAAE
jgi:hypothetical protein